MEYPEKLTTLGTQDVDKQNKNTTWICVGHHHTQTNNINKTWSLLKTTGGNDKPTPTEPKVRIKKKIKKSGVFVNWIPN